MLLGREVEMPIQAVVGSPAQEYVGHMIQRSKTSDPFACHIDKLKLYEAEDAPTWYNRDNNNN